MNVCLYKGRISSDVKLGETNSGLPVLNFSIAVKKKKAGEKNDCDFLPCVAYSNTAELIARYASKGKRILVRGRNTSTNYEDKTTGKIVYKTVTMVDEVDFIDFKADDEEDADINDPLEESAAVQ